MKTTIIEQSRKTGDFKPTLYRANAGSIVLATSERGGVIIHAADERDTVFFTGQLIPDEGMKWAELPGWTRITEPATITIRFEP